MGRVGPAGRKFEIHLYRHGIIMPWNDKNSGYPVPEDWAADVQRLHCPRPLGESLPSTQDDFTKFELNSYQKNEAAVQGYTRMDITGQTIFNSSCNLPYADVESMTADKTTPPQPDYLEGSDMSDLLETIYEATTHHISPQNTMDAPIIPNLTLEIKSGGGSPREAIRQACNNGAHGVRAIQAVDTWGRGSDEPKLYVNRACAYSAVYQDFSGVLELYSHHVEIIPDRPMRFRMTKLDSFLLLRSKEDLFQGVTAFRNLQDMAAECRAAVIEAANARARAVGAANQ